MQRASGPNQADSQLSGLHDLNHSRPSASGTSASRSAPSPEQSAVSAVLQEVRRNYYLPNFKSGNKFRFDRGDQEISRLMLAQQEIVRMRAQQYEDGDVISVAMNGEAHNCEELSRLAMYFLQDRGYSARIGQFGQSHGVAIIGAPLGELPADMTQWDPGIYICDPWCNIACRANDYPHKFVEKMRKWEDRGKQIAYTTSGFTSPTDSNWINTVLGGEKKAY
jgi:hypothetical protein